MSLLFTFNSWISLFNSWDVTQMQRLSSGNAMSKLSQENRAMEQHNFTGRRAVNEYRKQIRGLTFLAFVILHFFKINNCQKFLPWRSVFKNVPFRAVIRSKQYANQRVNTSNRYHCGRRSGWNYPSWIRLYIGRKTTGKLNEVIAMNTNDWMTKLDWVNLNIKINDESNLLWCIRLNLCCHWLSSR